MRRRPARLGKMPWEMQGEIGNTPAGRTGNVQDGSYYDLIAPYAARIGEGTTAPTPFADGGCLLSEAHMIKVIECGAVVPGCTFVMHGDSEEELLMKAIEHLHASHGIAHPSEPLKARIRAVMRDE